MEESQSLGWSNSDTAIVLGLVAIASFAHLWRLGTPNVLVYDEQIYVPEAIKYLHGESFWEVHPPFALELMAASMRVLGCSLSSWRFAMAAVGTALVPVTYLLARRMFLARSAAMLCALMVLGEGKFFQYSRLGLIDIVYVALGALAYVMLFRFIQVEDPRRRRNALAGMGVALGLCLGSKQATPIVTWMLVAGFVVVLVIKESRAAGLEPAKLIRRIVGVVALVGGLSVLFYVLVFLPNFLFGWWRGFSNLVEFERLSLWYNTNWSFPTNVASPWWSWPLMLRPFTYSTQEHDGLLQIVWSGGNPVEWWAALAAITIVAIRAVRRAELSCIFLAVGYFVYMAMWIPIPRSVYIYSYMPALYIALLALGYVIDLAWRKELSAPEEIVLMLPLFAACWFGFDEPWGAALIFAIAAAYLALLIARKGPGRFVCVVMLGGCAVAFFYFLPIWVAAPISPTQAAHRLWFSGGMADWR